MPASMDGVNRGRSQSTRDGQHQVKPVKIRSILSDLFDIQTHAGGDKPRPYRTTLTHHVGAGFIPAR